jgi:hypothetical protein
MKSTKNKTTWTPMNLWCCNAVTLLILNVSCRSQVPYETAQEKTQQEATYADVSE